MSLNDTTQDTPVKLCECGCGQPVSCRVRYVKGHHLIRPVAERFHEKINKNTETECWEWTGAKTTYGYGTLSVNSRTHYAHRLAWELENGPIPDGMEICHHCDNPRCVRVSHLFLGTHADNSSDMTTKSRQVRGEMLRHAIFTAPQVVEIRQKYARGNTTYRALAAEYGVSTGTIGDIVRRTNWSHIP